MDALQYLKEKYEIEGNTHYFREPDLPLSTSLEKVCKYMQEYSDQQNAELLAKIAQLEESYTKFAKERDEQYGEYIDLNVGLRNENAELRERVKELEVAISKISTITVDDIAFKIAKEALKQQ